MPPSQTLRPIARRALSAQSDQRLIQLVREDHAPAFEEIVRRYRSPLVAFAAAIVSANGAEDVVQTSLAKAHEALRADSRQINLRPWLFAIVRNGALNAIRGEPRIDELDEALSVHSNPSEIAEGRDDFNRLVVAMCALPEAQRQALVKRELEGVGHGEIAAQMGTTSTAVRGLIFRARTQVRNAMGALVPLPVLRALLAQGSAVGAAGGGTSAALLGGAGAKGGAAIAAAVLALGAGIAIEKHKGAHSTAQAEAAETHGDGGTGSPAGVKVSSALTDPGRGANQAAGGGSTSQGSSRSAQGHSPGSQSAGSSPGGSGGADDSEGTSGSSGSSGGGDDGGHQSSGGTQTPPPSSDDGGSSHGGPGPSGDDGGGDDPVISPPSGSDGNSSDKPDDPEPPEVEDDNSGPGVGDNGGDG